ncbi:MAG: adenine deaminase [Planctomycetota bacterium]
MRHPPTNPCLIAVARGDAPADLVLADARVVNVFTRQIERGDVAIAGGRFAGVGAYPDAAERVDMGGAFIAPGLIDAHMHVESTMLTPRHFAPLALAHGTTGVVLDPHEIANVLGVEGIRWLMDDAASTTMRMWFAVSSCVPASPFETAGAVLEANDLAPLFEDPRVVALAEMMNFPGVVHADPGVLAKVDLGLERSRVDGHCPGLRGPGLRAYRAAGISSDHECTTREEAEEKVALGMRVYLREGSAARNLEALIPAVTPANAHRFCFCTDDRHPADLAEQGHIDHVVRRAVDLGMDPVLAIAIGSLHAAEHYALPAFGAVAPGYHADFIVFDNLADMRPREVFVRGKSTRGAAEATSAKPSPRHGRTILVGHAITPEMFRIAGSGAATLRVIGMLPGQLLTEARSADFIAVNGAFEADPEQDVLKLAVIERHTGSGGVGLGFVQGFEMPRGAIASTVGHDSHNLTVLGTNDTDMAIAAEAVAGAGGGQAVSAGGKLLAVLKLPVAGLMSDQPAEAVVAEQAAVLRAAASLGTPLEDPFMPLSFLPLTVIPSLKLGDKGLVDVDRFELVPLQIDPAAD